MYHYLGCGLPNVFLKNGYELTVSHYGKGVTIHDLEGLHDAIGEIVVSSPGPLAGNEFKFLRNELELSQAALAHLLGCDEQSVARWEKGKNKQVNAPAERLLRRLYQENKKGAKNLTPLLKTLQKLEATPTEPRKIVASERADNWSAKTEVCAV
jgi:DNA-binding transcriptional regulator YiaG